LAAISVCNLKKDRLIILYSNFGTTQQSVAHRLFLRENLASFAESHSEPIVRHYYVSDRTFAWNNSLGTSKDFALMPRIGFTASTRNNLTMLLVLGSEEGLVGMSERWTVCCSFFLLIAASLPTSTSAQNPIDDEARTVTAGCHEALKRTGRLQTFDAGMCLGILKGLHHLSKDICIPPATSLGQIGDVVSQYLDSHAGEMDDDFQETALAAMRSAWPCGKRNNI
jgi:hypothetical protein